MLSHTIDTDREIIKYCDSLTIYNLSLTCKFFYSIFDDDYWKGMVKRDYNVVEYKPLTETYKIQYLQLQKDIHGKRCDGYIVAYNSRPCNIPMNLEFCDNVNVLQWAKDRYGVLYNIKSSYPLWIFKWLKDNRCLHIVKVDRCKDVETYIWLYQEGYIDIKELALGFTQCNRVDLLQERELHYIDYAE